LSEAARRWDERYSEVTERHPPAAFVTGLRQHLGAARTAIDLGGGSGRHAVWLADQGLDVTLVDVAHRALAQVADPRVATVQHDLEVDGWPAGTWDVILFHYFFDRQLLRAAADHLAAGGLLAVAQPTVVNLERHTKPSRRFLLEPGELADLVAALPLLPIHLSEGWTDDGRHEARLIARRDNS
jgi:tellurite methyltransferase